MWTADKLIYRNQENFIRAFKGTEHLWEKAKTPNDEIRYISTDGNIVEPHSTSVFGSNIVSNTYSGGMGIIKFDGPVTSVGYSAFLQCETLSEILLPNTITSFGNQSFQYCFHLKSINIPYGITELPFQMFLYANELETIILPPTLTTIGTSCFSSSGLSNITIPASVTTIENNAFGSCINLKSLVIPSNVTTIGDRICIGSGLVSVNVAGVYNISANAFASCSELTTVILNEGSQYIKNSAFSGCTSLTHIIIPSTIRQIGRYSFSGCTGLLNVIMKPTTPPSIASDSFNNTGTRTFTVPCNSYTSYITASIWSTYSDYIVTDCFNELRYTSTDGNIVTPYDLTAFGATIVSNTYSGGEGVIVVNGRISSIGNQAFYQCSTLQTINIPASVTTIGNQAFEGCTGLTSCVIPYGVNSIGTGSFRGCSSMTSCTIPNSVTSIGTEAFKSSGLISIVVPSSVYNINSYAFWNCRSLISATIGSGVTIPMGAFMNCSSLVTINIPSTIQGIGDYAFNGCSSLTSISIPNVTIIGREAFNASGLTSFDVPDGLTTVGDGILANSAVQTINIGNNTTYPFPINLFWCTNNLTTITVSNTNTMYDSRNNCNALIHTGTNELIRGCKGTVIPNTVVTLGFEAFEDVIGFSSIAIPNSVTTISNRCFAAASQLQSVIIDENDSLLTTIGDYAFRDTALTSITIPSRVTNIGQACFYYCLDLVTVYPKPTTPPVLGSAAFNNNASGRKIYVSENLLYAYKGANGWRTYRDDIVALPTPVTYDGLKLKANTAGSTVSLKQYGTPTEISLYYSTDGNEWSSYTIGTELTLTNVGDYVYFRGDNSTFSMSLYNFYMFSMTGSIAASGNVMSLVDSSLQSVTIPATYCYFKLFFRCSSLTSAPALPATTLTNYCYSYMFYGCTGLTSAPVLPATTLTNYCYNYMFYGCTGLTSAPVLPAITLIKECYGYMFYGCSNLNYIKALFTTSPGISYTRYWVEGVSGTGTFVKNSSATWDVRSSSGIPTNWTVETE